MSVIQQTTETQQYGTAKGWRVATYVLAPPMIALFIALPFIFIFDSDDKSLPLSFTIVMSVLSLGMAGFFGYCLVEVRRWRLLITPTHLISTGTLKTKEIALVDILGFRTDQNYTRVVPRQKGQPTIKFSYTTEHYQQVLHWLASRYPNLDLVELQQSEETLLADPTLGADQETRTAKLAAAKKTANVLNVAGAGAALWLFFQPQPYQWAVAAGLLVPLLAAAALWLHPDVLRIDARKNSAYPSVSLALWLPSVVLILRALFDAELVSYDLVWPMAGTAAVGVAALLVLGSRYFLRRKQDWFSTLATALLMGTLYGFGATTASNAAFDEAEPAVFKAQVLNKHKISGRSTTYYLTVTPWGPYTKSEDVTVSSDYYERVNTGNTVQILLMPGRLGVPWYTVAE